MSVLITPTVARDITKIIREHHGAMAAAIYGREAVSQEDWAKAIALGIVDPDEDSPQVLVEAMNAYGAMLAHLDQASAQSRYGDTLEELQDEIRRNPVPQTVVEAHAARHAAQHGAAAIVGLGNVVDQDIGQVLIEHDRTLDQKLRGLIRDVTAARFGDDEAAARIEAEGVSRGFSAEYFDNAFRSTINRQVSDIGHLTGDWSRDLERVVQTEMTAASHSAQTESWEEQEDEHFRATGQARDILVFRLPRGDACRYCIELYLDGGAPRLFKMKELLGNGTNVGKKRAAWMPIEGPTHPFCGCSLHRVPAILDMPKSWRSGEAAPSVIGPGGQVVMGGR
jgi:hypothetical protein